MTKRLAATLFATTFGAAALAQDLPQSENAWYTEAQERLQVELRKQINTNRAKNVILMISDGNGVGTNYASRLWAGQQAGGYGDEHVQSHEAFPHLALVKTYNVNAQTPDSAGTGTAMMTGIKTIAGVLGVTEAVQRGACETIVGNTVASINEVMFDLGKATGIVSTARITHATPAAAYAKSVDRNFEAHVPDDCTTQKDIATQLIDAMEAGIITLAMGGGYRNFHAGNKGRRRDDVNLVERAQAFGTVFVNDQATFDAAPKDGTPILGLFQNSHMKFEADRHDEPSLAEMTAAAITTLQTKGGDRGFFLQVEAGRVDHANHAGNLARVVADQKAFADAVATADMMTEDSNTLIVVTADHEHAIAFNGYCGRGSDITGLCMGVDGAGIGHTGAPELASDGKPYTVAGYLNGPGSVLIEQTGGEFFGSRPIVTEQEATDIDYVQQALVPRRSETHSGEDVAVYAKGPFAHLFDGTIEQNLIFHVMQHAATAE